MSTDRSDDEYKAQIERLSRAQAALVKLARRPPHPAADVSATIREICVVAATTLHVERVSVWLLSRDRQDLRCLDLYELSDDRHSAGLVLRATEYPRYFEALELGRAIDAGDARTDPRTSEFTNGYLIPLGITSMMDAAVRDEGRVIGVICHEHVGSVRAWTQDEVAFAGALGDRVSLVLATAARRRLEQERERMRQLQGLGVLAAGFGKSFSVLLTEILDGITRARGELAGANSTALDDAVSATGRASRLAQQMMLYSGRSRAVLEPLDLSTQITELGEMLTSSTSQKVAIRFDLARDLMGIKADPLQMRQIVTTLVLNGAEAIGDAPGEVRITTGMRFLSASDVESLHVGHAVTPGRFVMLEIEDTGRGIEGGVLDELFDPLSTQAPMRALNLSAVVGIVRSHRGALHVTSTPRDGTTFRLYFPAMDVPARPSQAAR